MLVFGTATLSIPAQTRLYTFYSPTPLPPFFNAVDYLGTSVSIAGDVNKDGFADVIVGAPLDANNGVASGSARVLSGKALSLTTDCHAFSLA